MSISRKSPLPQVRLQAAQYLRMSTEHQQYSPQNQADTISKYAASFDIDIVDTYSDYGRSGLSLAGRTGLISLLDDVDKGRNKFSVLLVYDISRWGRFQDTEESAYHEYVLKKAGVHVHYCAEQFVNDGSLSSILCKTIKRVMAGEFSRELSVKVFAGQCRLIEKGFRQGGLAGYGLRRLVLDKDGTPKMTLQSTEQKNLQTDRVILSPGPKDEVDVVVGIYRNFIEGMGETAIAARLNAQGLNAGLGRSWTMRRVHEVLSNPKYTGTNVYNKTSFKLKGTHVRNPPEAWVSREKAFEAIIPTEHFQAAQQIFSDRGWARQTDEVMLAGLQGLLKINGQLSYLMIDGEGSLPCSRTYKRHFGNVRRAYSLVGWQPKNKLGFIKLQGRISSVRRMLIESIVRDLSAAGASSYKRPREKTLLINGELKASVSVVLCRESAEGLVWKLRGKRSRYCDVSIIARMSPGNVTILDYYVIPSSDPIKAQAHFRELNPLTLQGYRFDSLDFFVDLCKRKQIGIQHE